MADIGKVSNVAAANIAKVANVAKANIAKVSGIDMPASGGIPDSIIAGDNLALVEINRRRKLNQFGN